MGRNSVLKDAVQVHITIPLAHKKFIQKMADEHDESISSIYRIAIADFIASNKPKPKTKSKPKTVSKSEPETESESKPKTPRKRRKKVKKARRYTKPKTPSGRRGVKFLTFLARHIGTRPKDDIWITRAQLLTAVEVSTWDRAFAAAQWGVDWMNRKGHEAMVDLKKDGNTVMGIHVRIMGTAITRAQIEEVYGGNQDAMEEPEEE